MSNLIPVWRLYDPPKTNILSLVSRTEVARSLGEIILGISIQLKNTSTIKNHQFTICFHGSLICYFMVLLNPILFCSQPNDDFNN
jgi:hypothetical protein